MEKTETTPKGMTGLDSLDRWMSGDYGQGYSEGATVTIKPKTETTAIKDTTGISFVEELAEVFYEAKVPDGRWKSIPQNAKDGYIKAMQAVLDYREIHYG